MRRRNDGEVVFDDVIKTDMWSEKRVLEPRLDDKTRVRLGITEFVYRRGGEYAKKQGKSKELFTSLRVTMMETCTQWI